MAYYAHHSHSEQASPRKEEHELAANWDQRLMYMVNLDSPSVYPTKI